MEIILGILTEGLVYSILSLGVYITYKILDFPDLSVDGTFPLGGAVTVFLILNGVNPLISIMVSSIFGAFFGLITGIIHVKFGVRDLIAGIIVMTALYSVNLNIAKKSNVSIFDRETIFENPFLDSIFTGGLSPFKDFIILLLIVLFLKILLDLYLKTKSGLLLRAVGDNEHLVTSLAVDKGNIKILGLMIANALSSLAGAVYTQMNGFFEISIGTGTVVVGLANVIIGLSLSKKFSFIATTTAVIIGSILYKASISASLSLGLPPRDLKLITAVFLLIILLISKSKLKRRSP